MAVPAWMSFMGIAKETTWGTAVPATTFFRGKPKVALSDKSPTKETGFSGIAAETHGYSPGVRDTSVDTGSLLFYGDDTVHLLMGILGVDTVSGSGPYTHTITLLNTGLPPSYTFQRFTGAVATADQIAGMRWSEVDLKFSNPGTLSVEAKGLGKILTQATKPTNAYSTLAPYLPWQGVVTYGGSSYAKLIDGQLTIKRNIEPIYGMNGAQDQSDQNADVLGVTGSLTVVPADLTEFNYYLNGNQEALSVAFIPPTGTNQITFQMTKAQLLDGTELDDTKTYLTGMLKFEGIANSTDGGTGNSPLKVIAVNAKTTTY